MTYDQLLDNIKTEFIRTVGTPKSMTEKDFDNHISQMNVLYERSKRVNAQKEPQNESE